MSCVCFMPALLLTVAAVTSVDIPSAGPAWLIGINITEFYIDTPQDRDQDEYVEISGPANTVFADAKAPGQFTYYLLMLENVGEDAGKVDKIVPLGGTSLNDNGFAWFYGSGGEAYPAEDGYQYSGTSENSGCTLLLVAVPFGTPAPAPDHDYDATSDGVAKLGGDWDQSWVVLGDVGVFCNGADLARGGALYASVNFAAGEFANVATPYGSINTNTDLYDRGEERGAFDEIEYVGRGRQGRWFAANLTDSGPEWSAEQRNYGIANDDENDGEPEAVDQTGRIPYYAFSEITVHLGERGPSCDCETRSRAQDTVDTDPQQDTTSEPTPTLAEPAQAEPTLSDQTSLVAPD